MPTTSQIIEANITPELRADQRSPSAVSRRLPTLEQLGYNSLESLAGLGWNGNLVYVQVNGNVANVQGNGNVASFQGNGNEVNVEGQRGHGYSGGHPGGGFPPP
jgi:hypothetical protein